MLSHELRTPLSPISLGVDDLREDERFVEARPTLAMIRRNIDLQARLLEELFDFTKIGQHKVRMRLGPVDAHEAVGFVLEICKAEVTAAKIEVILDLAAPEKIVLADTVRLQQVMWNLIKNAVKFSTPGGSISIISANDAAGGLTLQFVDHGVGIEPALLPLIFDPFRQGHHAKPHLSGGLGLGLFIAKGLVEAQGGTLTAFSEGHGKGSTFSLRLTKASEVPVPPPIE
jgi:signal transduction histidine kinase